MWLEHLLSLLSIYLFIAVTAGVHVLLYVRNSRAAFGWLGLIIVFPIAGALLYALFGINRVKRKAKRVSREADAEPGKEALVRQLTDGLSRAGPGFRVTGSEPLSGNGVRTCYDGEEAFPRMLDAIEQAQREVLLSSYIFDNDTTGKRFVDKLSAARERGCQVRVLVDDVGIRYSFPSILGELKKHRLAYRRFMPMRLFPPGFSINLRTHRKVLILDRKITFAGGMNIGDRQLVNGPSPHRASDLHFRFEGPLTTDCVRLFADDWKFSGGEPLQDWVESCPARGTASCRLISDGPDDTLDSLMLVIMGVISSAQKRVWIMTPYFLPERQILGCLQAAALTGVDVQVMVPQKNNWPMVQWALQHNMSELLDAGVQILRRPPPFAHSKCMVIDDDYALVGSSNLDPRSLRLNFELGVELFDSELNSELSRHFKEMAGACAPFTLDQLRGRGTLARLRDGASALFTPYL
ncbi:MAG: cardiolipin synthase [Xanthomonadales bacterium]|nr:PLDc N-terminal domain-containing protein [Gammaproteobacteria bacterium]MBT8054605.1 PLDc N-terminal domain-containing protein [Gammaproteobacteria bacterium]NND58107.1 cardiolipin synthase [Xanthomonadales bacterium]NNK50380.1 cardiolipin synthase [Xanthomonadales bacterium]